MKDYDTSKESKYIMNLDANSLYGGGMSSVYPSMTSNGERQITLTARQ